jgi:hypothetical protein
LEQLLLDSGANKITTDKIARWNRLRVLIFQTVQFVYCFYGKWSFITTRGTGAASLTGFIKGNVTATFLLQLVLLLCADWSGE